MLSKQLKHSATCVRLLRKTCPSLVRARTPWPLTQQVRVESIPSLSRLHSAFVYSGISERTPGRVRRLNQADRIESELAEDGHRKWGFVVYRSTYDSDSDWNKVMKLLRIQIDHSLQFDNGTDMLDSLDVTVIADVEQFADAPTSLIREHFRQWVSTAPQREQDAGAGLSQRYRYCVQIDKGSLQSILGDEHPLQQPGLSNGGFVKLIWANWTPHGEDHIAYEFEEEEEEPLEGCTEEDVGWMMVTYPSVMPGMYLYLREQNSWYTSYRRPPVIASG